MPHPFDCAQGRLLSRFVRQGGKGAGFLQRQSIFGSCLPTLSAKDADKGGATHLRFQLDGKAGPAPNLLSNCLVYVVCGETATGQRFRCLSSLRPQRAFQVVSPTPVKLRRGWGLERRRQTASLARRACWARLRARLPGPLRSLLFRVMTG